MANNTLGEAQVPENDFKQSSTEVWFKKTPSSFSKSPHSNQALKSG
jgi:hypothetical protein